VVATVTARGWSPAFSGFSPLPPVFVLILAAVILKYLGMVECAKVVFRAAQPRVSVKPPPQPARLPRRIARRVSHFTRQGLAP
jgi:hypothetical protein